jgi:hypothetical protein
MIQRFKFLIHNPLMGLYLEKQVGKDKEFFNMNKFFEKISGKAHKNF